MSAGTRLALVVPWAAHAIIDKDGNASGQFVARDVADVQARDYDTSFPHRAPHTVQQLARVVALVDTETVVHVACSRDLVERFAAESEPVTMRVVIQDGIEEMVFTRYTPPALELSERTCSWRYMDWPDSESDYEGSCGCAWTFTEGGIEHNDTKFCPRCGGRIVFTPPPADDEDDGDEDTIDAARAAEGGTL